MNINSKLRSHQQQRFTHHKDQSDSWRFFNLLTSPEFFDALEASLPAHRERLFPPTETLSLFLAQAMNQDRSCQRAVNDTAIQRLRGGLPLCSTNTGAYCQARKRLPLRMPRQLKRHVGEVICQQTPEKWRWRNRSVKLVDGTTVSLPDTTDNQLAYPQSAMQKPGLGFPSCRLLGLFCLASGALLDSAISPIKGKGSSEQSLLRSLLHHLDHNDVLLGDAYYATYFLYCALHKRGVDAVFEQHGARRLSTDFSSGKRLGKKDHLITLTKPRTCPHWMPQDDYDQAPKSIVIRELYAGGKLLVTTLLCPKKTSKQEIKALYQQRWNVELDFRHIKTTLGMDILTCRTPEMAQKELEVYLLAYNLIRYIMLKSALLADILPRQISFKHALQLWLCWHQHNAEYDDQHIAMLLLLISSKRVANRPGRIEPRAIKRRPNSYPLLMTTREIARQGVRENGHPKKLK